MLSVIAFAAGMACQQSAAGAELITNGNFEAGSFVGWTGTDRAGGSGSFFLSTPGANTPLSGVFPTSAAGGLPHGSFYAVSDQLGPGTHALAQGFVVAAGAGRVVLSFDLFVNDQSGIGPIVNPAGLDHNAVPNQHARVDVLSAGAGPFDTGATVLGNFYLGVDLGVNPNPFAHYEFDITALVGAGGSFILRFAEVDNQGFLNAGVDNVSVFSTDPDTVPEPATLWLLGIGMLAIGLARRRLTQI
jgi:hypothetical protein